MKILLTVETEGCAYVIAETWGKFTLIQTPKNNRHFEKAYKVFANFEDAKNCLLECLY